jgi:hypothetical protein
VQEQLPTGSEGPSRPDAAPRRRSLASWGLVLMGLATAMTLPAFIWIIGGGLCGPGSSTCNGPADIPFPALILLWLSVPLGSIALGILLHARWQIRRAGRAPSGLADSLAPIGYLLTMAGTVIVAYIAYTLFVRVATEPI